VFDDGDVKGSEFLRHAQQTRVPLGSGPWIGARFTVV
jgi:hypothetical protein